MHSSFSIPHKQIIAIIAAAIFLAACGDGDGPDKVSATEVPPMEGTFVDSAVEGLAYETSGGVSGLTDEDGVFEYKMFEQVSFSIGDIDLGSAPGAPYVTPVETTNSPDPTAQAALNMLIFLQSIDSD